LMTIIEIWPNKFSNQNFVRQGLPAKSQMVPFRFTSLIYLDAPNVKGCMSKLVIVLRFWTCLDIRAER
jgi:hypothetical protein